MPPFAYQFLTLCPVSKTRFLCSGCVFHARAIVFGKPSASVMMTKRTSEFGTLKNGKICVVIWAISDTHAVKHRGAINTAPFQLDEEPLWMHHSRLLSILPRSARTSGVDIHLRSCARLSNAVSARIQLQTSW